MTVEPLQVIVLSLIQGITEFLPVSSAAHLILPAQLTHWQDQGLQFDVAVHLGSLTSILVYFRRELTQFAVSATRMRWDDSSQLLFKIVVATIPVIAAGILLKPVIETELRTVSVIGMTTIVFGLVLWWADRRVDSARDEYSITFGQALMIGIAQVLALIPGTSRSGITITTALLAGIGREGAARFSFLLAIPTITGAALFSAIEPFNSQESVNWSDLGVGFALSATSSYACIAIFIALLNRTRMTPYVIYRILLGSLLLVFL